MAKQGELLASSEQFDLLWSRNSFNNVDDHVQFTLRFGQLDIVIGHGQSKYLRALADTHERMAALLNK